MDHIDIGIVAMGSTPWALEKNYERFEAYVRQAALRRAGLVVAPEAVLDGYPYVVDAEVTPQRMRLIAQEAPDGPYLRRAALLARELRIFLALGFLEKQGEEFFNAAILLGPDGEILLHYRKVHPDIEAHITPGKVLAPVPTPLGKVGMLICSDRNTVDNFGTLGAQGVELVLLPMNGGGGPENTQVLQQRARDNCCAIVVANSWSSAIIGPYGEIYLARYEIECVSVGRLYLYHAPRGAQRDQFIGRRPDLYGPLTTNMESQPMFDARGEPTPDTLEKRRVHLANLKARQR